MRFETFLPCFRDKSGNNRYLSALRPNVYKTAMSLGSRGAVIGFLCGLFLSGLTTNAANLITWGASPADRVQLPDSATNLVSAAPFLALRSDSTVVAWGPNEHGQTNVPAGLTNVIALASGSNHRLALRSDGTVVSWGKYAGFPVFPGSTPSYEEAIVPPGLSNVISIAAGSVHNLALRTDGTVVAWGKNLNAQCDVPPGLSNVVSIAAGARFSLALKNDGTVVGWGDNEHNQLVSPSGVTNISAIAAGPYHTVALTAAGTVLAWGSDFFGETNVPDGLTNVISIAAGSGYSLALKGDSTVVEWPMNGLAFAKGLTNAVQVIGDASERMGASERMALTTMPVIRPAFVVASTNTPVLLEVLFPAEQVLSFQWYQKLSPWSRSPIPGATNKTFVATSGGQYVVDILSTAGEQTSTPSDVRFFAPAKIANASFDANGFVELTFQSLPYGMHRIDWSTNAVNWSEAGYYFHGRGQFHYDEIWLPRHQPAYFFRSVQID